MKNLKNILVVFLVIIFSFLGILLVRGQSSSESQPASPPWGEIKSLNLDWPFDKHSGFLNYAQELVFNKEKGMEYLDLAKQYYKKGYDAIKRYQKNPDVYDPYERDAYRFDAISPYGMGVFRDFILAEYWFAKAMEIVARKLEWDPNINTKEEYKNLVGNSFKNLIFVTVYKGQYERALAYLNEYKKFMPEKKFINEWEARILGNIVLLHKTYDWVYTGDQSYLFLKTKHRRFLMDVIDETYSSDPKLRDALKKRIYPEYFIFLPQSKKEESSQQSPAPKQQGGGKK